MIKSISEGKRIIKTVLNEINVASMADEHRAKALFQFRGLLGNSAENAGDNLWIYMRGNSTSTRLWTDTELEFRQESFFWYMTGLQIPDFHLLIRDPFGLQSKVYIVSPRYSNDHSLWCGTPFSLEQLAKVFPSTEPVYADQIKDIFASIVTDDGSLSQVIEVHTLPGTPLRFLEAELELAKVPYTIVQDGLLCTAITEARVLKTGSELKLLAAAAETSAEAHKALMRSISDMDCENDAAALFVYECSARGARIQAYTPIAACGRNASILHYTCNSADFTSDKNELVLVDAGCELQGYASDITRCFPRSGVFSGMSATVYRAVLDANKQVIAALKPGLNWEDMHALALSVILDHLLDAKLVRGNTEADKTRLTELHIPDLFFPHGLGHLLGLDVHDCGGYPQGTQRFKEGSLRYLRMRRKLEAGMVLTVEPGLYFVDAILLPAFENADVAKNLNIPLIKEYMANVGGVRIEDDVLITTSGCRVLTDSVPKEISEIEALMKL